MTNQLTPEALAVIAKVEKLLALAGNNDNEHQAAAASAKAMELLAAYNLDMAQIGKSGKGSQRSDTRLKGGLYSWQRDLWKYVAELNFCLYRSIQGLTKGAVYEHRVIGSHVNVVSAKVMADYLQQTVERLAQEWAKGQGFKSVFVKEAIAYREGMAERLTERLWDLRRERLRKDEEAKAGRPSTGTPGTALVLADVLQTEDDLNHDILWGDPPGTRARYRAEHAARQAAAEAAADQALRERDEAEAADPMLRAMREAEEEDAARTRDAEYAAWCKRQARNEKRRKGDGQRYRAETPREQRRRMDEFSHGYERGADIGLDQQVDRHEHKRL